jgi:hypothetical protein
MKQKEQLKALKKEMQDISISLKKFLILYYGLDIEYVDKLSHRDIKELIPDSKRISYEELLNRKKDLYTGNVVAVRDCFGDVVPYIKPNIEITHEPILIGNCKRKKEENLEIHINLSTYELSILCKKFKLSKQFGEYRKAYRALKSKKEVKTKKFIKERYSLMVKENDIDEY